MAHDAVMLEIPIDTGRLYDGDDPGYELWLTALADRVHQTRERIHREEEKAAKGRKR